MGILIAQNRYKKTIGIITDGQIRRFSQKIPDFQSLPVKKIMTKKPISIDKQLALTITMNNNKITSLIVNSKKSPQKIGVVHVHTYSQHHLNVCKKSRIILLIIIASA